MPQTKPQYSAIPAPKLVYAFGSSMVERCKSFGGSYKYGFNNQEQEKELGEYYSFEYRVHDARLGRFLSVDPLAPEYPWNSCYAFAENRVIDCMDLEGLESANVITGDIGPLPEGPNVVPLNRLISDGVNINDKNAVITWGKNHSQFGRLGGLAKSTSSSSPPKNGTTINFGKAQSTSRDNLSKIPITPKPTAYIVPTSNTSGPCSMPVSCTPGKQCPACYQKSQAFQRAYLNAGGTIISQGKTALQIEFDNLPDFNKGMITNPLVKATAVGGAIFTTAVAAVEAAPIIVSEATLGLKAPTSTIIAKGAIEGIGQFATGGVKNIDPLAISTSAISSPGFGLFFQSTTSWKPFETNSATTFTSTFATGNYNKSLTSTGLDFGFGIGFGAIGRKVGGIGNLPDATSRRTFQLTLGFPVEITNKAFRKTIENKTGN